MINVTETKFLYKPTGELWWSKTHAQVPFVIPIGDRIRIYYSTRDAYSRSSVSFIDFNNLNDFDFLESAATPCLSFGQQGNFDDSGTMPSWFIKDKERILLYYTGWNRSKEASYRLSIGLAESTNDGKTFSRVFVGPILDRDKSDPVWVAQPCVLKLSENNWKMWYLSCQKIVEINGIPEPFYCVKYAESSDGINWKRLKEVCIGFDGEADAIGRPCVWQYKNKFWMIHSNRKALDYRTKKDQSYRLVLSNSDDGIAWSTIKDPLIKKTGKGWAGLMMEYSTIIPINEDGKFMVFHNGNGFGEAGFGYFTLELNLD